MTKHIEGFSWKAEKEGLKDLDGRREGVLEVGEELKKS